MEPINAMPTKDFFVRMITRDISLEDCILDLIDNSLDGARRQLAENNGADSDIESYSPYQVNLRIGPNEFSIEDNCGGISIDNAIHYAFRFGRHPDTLYEQGRTIGLYGIGMKRAIFKIGTDISIHSFTECEAFMSKIDVPNWLEKEKWEFNIYEIPNEEETGTTITITDINENIGDEFGDDTFLNGLFRIISRDYALFLNKGFAISINGRPVKVYNYHVKENQEFKSYRQSYNDGDVHVELIAGMAAPPPSDIEPSESFEKEYCGWFVLCNDRVVLAADKTDRTVWGDEGFPHWHYQYNGFMGMVLFNAGNPNLLPWTTTKRDIDESSLLYRRAIRKMKNATRPWIEYTNQRKKNLEAARKKEEKAKNVPLFQVKERSSIKVPSVSRPKFEMANILYQKPRSDVDKIRNAMGKKNLSYRAVGEKTFEYYLENEVDE